MQLRCQLSVIYKFFKILVLLFLGASTSSMAVAQEGAPPAQPLFGTVQTDGWAFELLEPESGTSIYLPFHLAAEQKMRNVIGQISAAEKKPIEFFTIQPNVEVFLFNSESLIRIDGVETDDLTLPLTPCPAGYCLPPWVFDSLERLSTSGWKTGTPRIPVVDVENFGKYLQPME